MLTSFLAKRKLVISVCVVCSVEVSKLIDHHPVEWKVERRDYNLGRLQPKTVSILLDLIQMYRQ